MQNRMSVGIVSLYGLYNYGNRLQGFAVDQLVRELGATPTTIVLSRKLGISNILSIVKSYKIRFTDRKAHSRLSRFRQFINEQNVLYVYTPFGVRILRRKFDFFLAGSDQVWHPNADIYGLGKFLSFATPEQRISLSASFGVARIPSANEATYRKYLSSFRALSVRELTGIDIVRAIASRDAVLLPDPTLAIDSATWRTRASKSLLPQSPYVLLYFLGGVNDSTYQKILENAMKSGHKIVDLSNKDSPYWIAGPQDFLGLIDGSSLVYTDSYHACVFSIIFRKNFRVFRRNELLSTYDRITTLLTKYGLEDHEDLDTEESLFNPDKFNTAHEIIAADRKSVLQYLKGAFDAP